VDLSLDELVRAAQELCGNDNDRGRTISNLLVLLLREIDEDFAGGVLYSEERKDGSTVIGNSDFLSVFGGYWRRYRISDWGEIRRRESNKIVRFGFPNFVHPACPQQG